ncbi:hypothetical protein [Armatimonas sp.]|uniref:hypothetical protein n=1 Tax=Armatimonas sp. TaxID=1872638 RepID=UPI00374D54E3
MKLEEVVSVQKAGTKDIKSLEHQSEHHRENIGQLIVLKDQLKRVHDNLGSAELDEAQKESDHIEKVFDTERVGLQQRRELLLQENTELIEVCQKGLTKAAFAVQVNPWVEEIKAMGKQFATELFEGVTGVNLQSNTEINRQLERSVAAVKKHHARLEMVHGALVKARERLESLEL